MRAMSTDAATAVRANAARRERLRHFDHFRAVTILLVVASHCYVWWSRDTIAEIAVANMITGATALFVFISGFFFHYAFHRDFDYRSFMRKKTVAVLVPYLVLSTALMVKEFVRNGEIWFEVEFSDRAWIDNIGAALAKYVTGSAHFVYWYVPFIMLMFVLSPVFMRFIDLRPRTQIVLTLGALAVAAVAWRPTVNINPLHSVVYLTGFYMMGILYSLNRRRVDAALGRIPAAVLWVAVGLIAVASAFAGQVGNRHKDYPWDFEGFDWMVPLKIAMIAAILATSLLFANRSSRILDRLAKTSFAIFFVHPWFIEPVKRLVPDQIRESALGVALMFVLVMAGTLVAIWVVKAVLKDRSRYIIGY